MYKFYFLVILPQNSVLIVKLNNPWIDEENTAIGNILSLLNIGNLSIENLLIIYWKNLVVIKRSGFASGWHINFASSLVIIYTYDFILFVYLDSLSIF